MVVKNPVQKKHGKEDLQTTGSIASAWEGGEGGSAGTLHMKGVGMLDGNFELNP